MNAAVIYGVSTHSRTATAAPEMLSHPRRARAFQQQPHHLRLHPLFSSTHCWTRGVRGQKISMYKPTQFGSAWCGAVLLPSLTKEPEGVRCSLPSYSYEIIKMLPRACHPLFNPLFCFILREFHMWGKLFLVPHVVPKYLMITWVHLPHSSGSSQWNLGSFFYVSILSCSLSPKMSEY